MPGTPVFCKVSFTSCSNLGRAALTCSRVTPPLFIFTACWDGCCSWHEDRAVPTALNPRNTPVVAVKTLRAWRREVGVARTLVNAVDVVESIFIRSIGRSPLFRVRRDEDCCLD